MKNQQYYWLDNKDSMPIILKIIDWAQKNNISVEDVTEEDVKTAMKSRL